MARMHDVGLLKDLVLILLVVLPATLLGDRLRLPTIVVYIFCGALIGPNALGWIQNAEEVAVLAEIGVVLLLFTIGLEFSLPRLFHLRRIVLGSGLLQITLTSLVVWFLAISMGFGHGTALALGCMVSLSSTVIVLRTLVARNELSAAHGLVALGILLLQDLFLVPMMLLFRVLSPANASISNLEIAGEIGLAIAGIVVLLLAGRYILPFIFRLVTRTTQRELFLISILFVVFVTAYAAQYFGLSLGLGALLAGLLLSESEYADQIVADALPMRDALTSLFFVSIGMYMDPAFIMRHLPELILIVVLVILGKFLIATLSGLFSGYNLKVAVVAGLSLSQIGEFSLVLAMIARETGIIDRDMHLYFISTGVITMLLTPSMVRYSEPIGNWLDQFLRLSRISLFRKPPPDSQEVQPSTGHILVIGYGKVGMYLCEVLRDVGITYTICEMNFPRFQSARESGHPAIFGDAGTTEILHALHVEHASGAVITSGTLDSQRRTIVLIRRLNPELYIIVRTRYIFDLDALYAAGASLVIAEEMEASVEIFSNVLRRHHVPRSVITTQAAVIRNEKYGPFLGEKLSEDRLAELQHFLT
ncbi:MAG: cation:proton antiporter, partial [Leptospiraceae bacterium]|nr:cation:proton antiporter [Leptospiraceae bacterium]